MDIFQDQLLEHQAIARLGIFVLLLCFFLIIENSAPRRKTADHFFSKRRFNNFLLLGVDGLAVRLLIPMAGFELALHASRNEIGLMNNWDISIAIKLLLTIIIFDLLIYIQHVAFHKLLPLWHIHRVHHIDTMLDVTTGVRFHPFEILLSLLYKMLAVLLIGPPATGIVLYEILLNSASLFTHSNIKLNEKIDHTLRAVIVTPDMHRIHHSSLKLETDSNYGNLFSCWDRLFATYLRRPEAGYDQMQIGLDSFRDASSSELLNLIKNPFITSR